MSHAIHINLFQNVLNPKYSLVFQALLSNVGRQWWRLGKLDCHCWATKKKKRLPRQWQFTDKATPAESSTTDFSIGVHEPDCHSTNSSSGWSWQKVFLREITWTPCSDAMDTSFRTHCGNLHQRMFIKTCIFCLCPYTFYLSNHHRKCSGTASRHVQYDAYWERITSSIDHVKETLVRSTCIFCFCRNTFDFKQSSSQIAKRSTSLFNIIHAFRTKDKCDNCKRRA